MFVTFFNQSLKQGHPIGRSYLIGAIAFKLLEIRMPQGVEDILSIFCNFFLFWSWWITLDSHPPFAFSSHLEWVENLFPPLQSPFPNNKWGESFVFLAFFNLLLFHMGGQIHFFAKPFHLWNGWLCQRWKYFFFLSSTSLQTCLPFYHI